MMKVPIYKHVKQQIMTYKLIAGSIWEQGPREKQEDSIFPKYGEIKDTDRLFILCDGMGGHSAGEVASATVCAALSDYILSAGTDSEGEFSDEDFKTALERAYDELDKKDDGAAKKMGTTLVFLKLHRNGCTIAHIGDSRVYHIRPGKTAEDTEILFQTKDHSLINDLIKIGELTPEEARLSRQKNIITRAMQPCMPNRSKADIYHSEDIQPGDYFMLCSDGILEQMEDDNIRFIFSAKGGDINNKIDILVKATAHNHDNHSAILVNITEVSMACVQKKTPQMPELQIAQVSDDEIPKTEVVENPAENHASEDPVKPHNRMRTILVFILCAVLVFGGVYLYRKVTEPKEVQQTEADISSETTLNDPQQSATQTIPDKPEVETVTIEPDKEQIPDIPQPKVQPEKQDSSSSEKPDSSHNTITTTASIKDKLRKTEENIPSSDESKVKDVVDMVNNK